MHKTLYIVAILTILLDPTLTYGGGGESCGFHIRFDNYELPSGVIPIKIEALCDHYQGRTATIIVSDGNSPVIENKLFEQKLTVHRFADTVFKAPTSGLYRFLVTVSDGDNVQDQAIVFTKENASKLVISDIKMSNNIRAGEVLQLEATVTDGLGNPVPTIFAAAFLPYPKCDDEELNDLTELRLSQISPSIFQGSINIPRDMKAGTYDLRIDTGGGPAGYQPTSTVVSVNVDNILQPPVTKLFHDIRPVNSEPGYTPGDTVVVEGKTTSDRCMNIISNVEIAGEFSSNFKPDIKIQNQTRSDREGSFKIEFQTDSNMPLGDYRLTLKARYNNEEYSYQKDIELRDIKKFTFEADGKVSDVEITKDPNSKVVSLTFDKEAKELVFVGKYLYNDTRMDRMPFRITIPHELLGGDIVIRKDGNETITLSGNNYWGDINGPWLDPKRELQHSYWVNAQKYEGFTYIMFVHYRPVESTLEITGTSVIPEFPFAIIIASVAIGVMLAVIRFRKLIERGLTLS